MNSNDTERPTRGAHDSNRDGSRWRRWDLHVHTPRSALAQQFPSSIEEYAKALFKAASDHDIAVIGLTDYFSIQGYTEVRELQRNASRLREVLGPELAERASEVTLLPNVEFRGREVSKGRKLNYHVIFSEKVAPEEIQTFFLEELRFTADAHPDEPATQQRLRVENVVALGERLRREQPEFERLSALETGMQSIAVDHDDVSRVLSEQHARFRGCWMFALVPDEGLSDYGWGSGLGWTRKALVSKAHVFFASNPNTREWALGGDDPRAFRREFKTLKPCVHGSDAHRVEDLFVPDLQRYTWIRADPTFEGLRQLLHEPAERVFIGTRPPAVERAETESHRLLTSVHFERLAGAPTDQAWFSGDVLLNPGLTAIIGKKGSGKSALADILGSLGNATTSADFSFLNDERFLTRKGQIAQHFRATLRWGDGGTETRLLSELPSGDRHSARVRYLPQRYLEEVCTDLQDRDGRTRFHDELEDVIFSHVGPADRLAQPDLRSLLRYKTTEIEANIDQLQAELHSANGDLLALQEMARPAHRSGLDSKLEDRLASRRAHEAAKPVLPAKAVELPGKPDGAKQSELQALVERIRELDASIDANNEELGRVTATIASLDRLRERTENFEAYVTRLLTESEEDATRAGVDFRQVVKASTDDRILIERRSEATHRRDALKSLLDPAALNSEAHARRQASLAAKALRETLDEPSRLREEHQRLIAVWEREDRRFLGGREEPESILGLQAQIEALGELPVRLAAARKRRLEIVHRIFAAKLRLVRIYESLYEPVQAFVHASTNPETTSLSFSAEINIEGLVDGLLKFVHHGRRGSFQGEKEARGRIEALTRTHDITSLNGLNALLREVSDDLSRDARGVPLAPDADVGPIDPYPLRDGVSTHQVADYVFGLDYLRPSYELRWNGRPIEQLSPGERGTLLLVFYLVVDKDRKPLILDQPEENLDNETVWEVLVPAIRQARARRQVVVVTHNANLAVVCDADQIIHASVDKAAGNRVTYSSGSIENPRIAQLVVKVLEGTQPAFDRRRVQYEPLNRVTSS